MSGNVCQTRKIVIDKNKAVADRIKDRLSAYKDELSRSGSKGIDDLKKLKNNGQNLVATATDDVTNQYLGLSWRKKRPDVTLLAELVLVVVLAIILYYVWPYLTGSATAAFSKEQFLRATKVPETAFTVEELAKVNLEVKALQDYAGYFKKSPYSLSNNGIYDLMVSVAILPFVMFFIQFVVPPFVIAYILWFIWRFWPYVWRAAWGWYLMLYNYFTSLAEGALGCKWYIRMVTGWDCDTPDFNAYFQAWKKTYIDIPLYYEKLKYIQKYYWARSEYYEKPYRKYITLPLQRYKIKAQFAKKLYVDRSVEVFLKKLAHMYPQYYTMPRDEFYKWLLSNNRTLAGVYAKAIQTKDQIEGRPYRSITKTGKQCTCPATKTPATRLKAALKEQAKDATDDIDALIKTTNEIYDKVNNISKVSSPSCDKADTVINNRKGIASTVLISMVVIVLVLYMISAYFGTPVWLKNVISPTSQYVSRGVTLISAGKSYYSLPLLYGSLFTCIVLLVRFY